MNPWWAYGATSGSRWGGVGGRRESRSRRWRGAGSLWQMSDEPSGEARDRPGCDSWQPPDASEQMRVRLAKVERLRAAGIEPYPVGYPRTHTIARGQGPAS